MALDNLEAGLGKIKETVDKLFELADSDVVAEFILDGQTYKVAEFNINFTQWVDHKHQPQNETRGGQFSIVLTQIVPDSINDWAKRPNKCKDGAILFKTPTSGTVMEVIFENAYCVTINKNVHSQRGTVTTLVIAPEIVKMNGITHDNRWRN